MVGEPKGRARQKRLSGESAKALADKVIESGNVVPKKIPDIDDIDGQTKTLIGALSSALMTATELPISMEPAVVGDLVRQLVAYGVRQTGHIDQDAAYAPAWITDGVRQGAVKLPEQVRHTEAAPVVARTAEAPKCPKKIARHARAVRRR